MRCLAILSVLLLVSPVYASIIDWSCDDDNDGAIVMNDSATTLTDQGDYYDLEMEGIQYDYPAHVEGYFTTDTEEDPIIWIIETVENETNFTWDDYHIDIGMNKDFSIDAVIGPSDWTWDITQPTFGQQIPNGGGTGWVGSIDYYAGTPIEIGQSGDFGFKISFLGSVNFCTEQVPTPEPATLAFLALGATALLRKRR